MHFPLIFVHFENVGGRIRGRVRGRARGRVEDARTQERPRAFLFEGNKSARGGMKEPHESVGILRK